MSSGDGIIIFESQVIVSVIMASRLKVRAIKVLLKFENSKKKNVRIGTYEDSGSDLLFTFFCDNI